MTWQRPLRVYCSTLQRACVTRTAHRAKIDRVSAHPRHPGHQQRTTKCTAAGDESPQLWDIVQYRVQDDRSGTTVALGVVQQTGATQLQVARLYEESPGGVWLVHDHDTETVPTAAVQGVLEADYGQRVDPDRISNPHGVLWMCDEGATHHHLQESMQKRCGR